MAVVATLAACSSSHAQPVVTPAPVRTFNVDDFGAVGDGVTDDTAALQKTLDAAAVAGGGEIELPAGKYLTGSLVLPSHVHLHLAAGAVLSGSDKLEEYPIVTARWEGIQRPCHRALISADHATDIAITGGGTIAGNGKAGHVRNPRGPALIEPIECTGVRIEGVTLKNADVWTLHPTFCHDVKILGVTFRTTGWNSDGIDPDSCQGVQVDRCTFYTGDDNIAIKSGKGQEGVRLARPCEDLTITNCTFASGISSIAFGSELSGGIRHVRVSHCTFQHGRAAFYLKSCRGRAGYVQDVQADHLVVGPEPLLEIQTDYSSNPDGQGVPGPDGLTPFSGISFSDVQIDSDRLFTINGVQALPVDGVQLARIHGTSHDASTVQNARNVTLDDVQLQGIRGPLFKTWNVVPALGLP